MGIVAINLSPFPSKANQAEPIRKLALKIWSVHALRKKERFHLWKVKAKDKKAGIALGNTIYHFQFGHFRASQEEGIYLRLKFNHPFPEPKTALKYALVAYGMNGKMLLEKIRELSEEEWKGGKEFVVQLNEAKMGPYLEKNGKPSILLAVKQFPEECSICKLETKERIGKFFGCSHHAHENCAQKWSKANKSEMTSVKCPICKKELEYEDMILYKRYTQSFDPIKAWDILLDMPILQNGNKPHYTYDFDVKKSKWQKVWKVVKKFKGEFTPKHKNGWHEIVREPGKSVEQTVAEYLYQEKVKTLKTAAEEAASQPTESITFFAPNATKGSIDDTDADAQARRDSWERAINEATSGIPAPTIPIQNFQPFDSLPQLPAHGHPQMPPAYGHGHFNFGLDGQDVFEEYDAERWEQAGRGGGDYQRGGYHGDGYHSTAGQYPISMLEPANQNDGWLSSIHGLFSNLYGDHHYQHQHEHPDRHYP